MTPKKRKATERADRTPLAKRASKGRAAKKQDDPVWATENANSHMVNQDLHAKYCDPKTYEGWTKDDWEEIHDCLPMNVPFSEDGYSVPITYFKYDPDWRRLVREFQEDLGAGRYEPDWQKEAAQAMEERAAGKFDKYKEDQYEAFWGQKQKPKAEDRAGESAKIKLADLVEAGRIKLGDDFSFRRVFEKKGEGVEGKWMIEKEIKVVAIDGSSLTVAIPPNQTKYSNLARQIRQGQIESAQIDKKGEVEQKGNDQLNGVGTEMEEDHNSTHGPNHPAEADTYLNGNLDVKNFDRPSLKHPGPIISDSHPIDPLPINTSLAAGSPQAGNLAPEVIVQVEPRTNGTVKFSAKQGSTSDPTMRPASSFEMVKAEINGADKSIVDSIETNGVGENGQASTLDRESDRIDPQTGCILHQVKTIKSFVDKIIEIDGRMNPKDAPILSNWRFIRLQRSNQDLGSLFDVREEFYVWKSPTIVKTPKRGRGNRKVQVEGEDPEDFEEQTKRKGKAATKKRAPPRNLHSDDNSKRTDDAGGAESEDQGDKDEREENDEDLAERESDSDFAATNFGSRNIKSKLRTKRYQERPRGSAYRDDDTAKDNKGDDGPKDGHKHMIEKAHLCSHCGNGFTTAGSLKRHIKGYCKNAPKD